MNLLTEKDRQMRDQGEELIWDWIAKKQEPIMEALNALFSVDAEGHNMPGMKCTRCDYDTMHIQITKKTVAAIKTKQTDYILAKELMTYDSGAEIYCPNCFHREPCDIEYQVEK